MPTHDNGAYVKQIALTGTHDTGRLERLALSALEDVMAGSDGWGCEIQVAAIDQLRHYLRMPPWCMKCSKEGHATFSHYGVKGSYGIDFPVWGVPKDMRDISDEEAS